MKKKKSVSIKWTILRILLLCWMIPVALMTGVLASYLFGNQYERTAQSYAEQLEFNNQLCVERLNSAVEDSREASYDGEIVDAIVKYRKGFLSKIDAYKECEQYLKRRYQRNSAFSATVLWHSKDPEDFYCGVYNQTAEGSYQDIRTYWDKDHEMIMKKAAEIGTMVEFICIEDRIYMLRNMVNSSYESIAVLVMRLSDFYCFGNIKNIPMTNGMILMINEEVFINKDAVSEETLQKTADETKSAKHGYIQENKGLYVYHKTRGDGYYLRTVLEIEHDYMFMPFYGWQYVVIGMLCALLPLIIFFMYQFRKRVTDPVGKLSEGYKEVENGNLGYQITYENKNQEFEYLTDSFNQMSMQMKNYFNRIYAEEIALKDARIMALQSHINPHFMNNTLEIINWEARLGGNEKVSKMIESLSTLMDAAIDRRKLPEVPLSEEMSYVKSYLYITKERLGKRLIVEIDLPDEIMHYKVPRLILQPLIENAIEHGVAKRNSGKVKLSGRAENNFLVLEIENDGGFSQEDEERIKRLLSDDYDTSKESSGNLGIANVNQRIRILYGDPCGLTIQKKNEDLVIARILIRIKN